MTQWLEAAASAALFLLAYGVALTCAQMRTERRQGQRKVLRRGRFDFWFATRWYCEPAPARRAH